MRSWVSKTLMFLGGVFVVSALIALVAGGLYWHKKTALPERIILEVNLDRQFIEHAPNDPAALALLAQKPRLRDTVEALEAAADDERVVALIARLGSAPMGLGAFQELRDAIIRFSASGKRTVAFAETFGDMGPANGSYYLAAAFDEIYLQPTGFLGLTGLNYEQYFVREALDRIGVETRFERRDDYKTAVNPFIETAYTEAHRESLEHIMDAQFGQILQGVAEGRGMSVLEARRLVNQGPFLWEEALEAGLVDGLMYRDEVHAMVKEDAGPGAELLFLSRYLSRAGRPHSTGTGVALIYGAGPIYRGASGYDPLLGQQRMGGATVAAAFREAIEDDAIEAIVFRIDSPGGWIVPSAAIAREVERAREEGKPVIATLGSVGASGGYSIALPADVIVAQPGTLTGSIGVFGGKVVTLEFWERLGVRWDWLRTSTNANVFSMVQDFSPAQERRFASMIDTMHEDFLDRVVRSRGLSMSAAQAAAQGRVWTGRDALDLGLVDALGGYPEALRQVRLALGLAEDAPLDLQVIPRPKPLERLLAEQFFSEGPDNSEPQAAGQTHAELLRALRPWLQGAHDAGLMGEGAGGQAMTPIPAPLW